MGRPATGQTPVRSFRPPVPLWEELKATAQAEGRSPSDALIEAMHDWVKKKRGQRQPKPPAGSP